MKLFLRLCLFSGCLLQAVDSTAQKVDLDRFYFDYSYLSLPREYIEPDQRTFGVRVSTSPDVSVVRATEAIYDAITVNGFKRTETKPSVGITLSISDVRFQGSESTSRYEDVKDKDGKITGRTYYYKLTARYSINGSYSIMGPGKDDEVKKPEPAPAAKTNRFLANVTKAPDQAAPTEGKRMGGGQLPMQLVFTSQEYTTSGQAEQYFERNQSAIRTDLISNYVNGGIASVNADANALFGYSPIGGRDFLWILDSKKHPEYEVQQEAIKAVKELMKGMKATESTTQLAQNLQPLLDYFESLKAKYPGDEKADKKMRYSAYYSLASLYYYLDQPDKVIQEATGLIKNDYDKKDGERWVEKAESLQKVLAKHHLSERHMTL